MKTSKHWDEKGNGIFSFAQQGNELLRLKYVSQGCYDITIANDTYKLIVKKQLKYKLEIIGNNDNAILEVSPKNWYSQVFDLKYNNESYVLKVRNNPLAEYVISKNNIECLAYGLSTNKDSHQIAARITERGDDQPLLFHVVLWHLFIPIIKEHTSDIFWWTLV